MVVSSCSNVSGEAKEVKHEYTAEVSNPCDNSNSEAPITDCQTETTGCNSNNVAFFTVFVVLITLSLLFVYKLIGA